MKPTTTIRVCIARCARGYRDGRGPARAELACAKALGNTKVDRAAAAAARRLGDRIHSWCKA